jgi:hypothetical protein
MRSVRPTVRFAPRAIVLAVLLATSFAQAQVPPPEKVCPAGGTWTQPIDLGAAATDSVPAAVAASENGDAMVVWFGTRASGERTVLTRRYVRQALNAAWQPAFSVQTLAAGAAAPNTASVALDAGGNAFAAWETGNQRIEIARFTRAANGSGQWGAPGVLSGKAAASAPVVALRSDGKVGLAFWQTIEPDNKRALRWALFERATGTWSPAATALVTGADEDIAPAVVFAREGHALLTYQHIVGVDTQTTDRRVRVFGRWFDPASRVWSNATTLSDALGTVTPWATPLVPQPRVTVDGDDQGVAAWRYRDPLGACEAVLATPFDAASKTWTKQAEEVGACIDPIPGSSLQPKSRVLEASLAPLNDSTTFVLWTQNNALGSRPEVRRRPNATTPWELPVLIPQPAVDPFIRIKDAVLAGGPQTSALWVQPPTTQFNSGFALFASNYSGAAAGCPARWSPPARIATVSRLQPLLRTPERSAVPVAVWVDPVGDVPHVFATVRVNNGLQL